MKKFIKSVFLIISILSLSEIILRKVFGFTEAVLFKADNSLEYIPLPQKRIRFGKNNFYNHFSQRNREITPADSNIILGFGDSVLNGGTQTDQDSLATTLLSKYLSNKYKKDILVTNISAGSWGPDNCYAYLKKYGNFKGSKILLVVSSHDAFDNMTFEKVVGVQPNYPNQQYEFAFVEVFSRYLYPRYLNKYFINEEAKLKKNNDLMINKYQDGMTFNSGFKNFKQYCDSTKMPLIIYLHADKQEIKSKQYNMQGKKIIQFCKKNNIPLIEELNYHFKDFDYRDDIHLSERGQRHLFDVIKSFY